MKKLILSTVVALFMSISFVSANELKPKKNYVEIREELSELLYSTTPFSELEKEILVKVEIRITSNNEIVVLRTNSIDVEINNYIKDKLNYKKLSTNELEIDKNYVFQINFKS
jgi:hypothetical protein